ncbi:MAG: hypothetical protein U1B30_15935 [Pseudomonadota bacterium]|nr:hypothetical protein [Pseudomonadota bacterium]
MPNQKNNQTVNQADVENMDSLRKRFSTSVAMAPTRTVSRKAFGLDINTVWAPFFTAHKAIGTPGTENISDAALVATTVLARDKDGNVRVSKQGKLTYRTNRELSSAARRQIDGYGAKLMEETGIITAEAPNAVAAQIKRSQEAARPIQMQDAYDVMLFEEELAKQAKAEAEPIPVAAD